MGRTRTMTLAGGRFGPHFTTQHTEKQWPSHFTRRQYEIKLWLNDCKDERRFDKWLTLCKHYGAEYYEED